MNTSPTAPLPLAAIVHADDRHDLEALLEQVARRLQYAGWHVAGLVHRQDHYANGNKRMQLHDLCSEQQFELSQDLGAASEACSLNPQALAQASAVAEELRQGLHRRPCESGELVIPVSASIGVHSVDVAAKDSIESALQVADQALYAAKAEGRDCVRTL